MRRMRRILAAVVFCLLASASVADDSTQANRLMVDAVRLIQASRLEPSPLGKFELLKQAHANLIEIIERHPSSDLAVKLATGQRIGDISLAIVRKAMDQARVSGPRRPGEPVRMWRHRSAVVAVASSSDGRWTLTASRDGLVVVRDTDTGEPVSSWRHGSGISAGALSPNGRRALMASEGGTVALYHARSGRVLERWQHNRAVTAVALSRAKGLVLVGAGQEAVLVDVNALEPRRSWRDKSPVTSVAYAPNGRWILAGFADGRTIVAEAGTGRRLHIWKHPGSGGGGLMSAAFSPDGRRILTGAANGAAVLRVVATGTTVHRWRVARRVTSVAYSPDGRWILTGDDDYEVELHDAESGRTVRKWRYTDMPTALGFTAEGRRALMGFRDGAAILCDIRPARKRRGYSRTFLTANDGCW